MIYMPTIFNLKLSFHLVFSYCYGIFIGFFGGNFGIDISRGGLAFRYIAQEEELNRSSDLDIRTRDTGFSLEKLPFKDISDSAITNEQSQFNLRRRSIQFGELTPYQASQLKYFIRSYTIQR